MRCKIYRALLRPFERPHASKGLRRLSFITFTENSPLAAWRQKRYWSDKIMILQWPHLDKCLKMPRHVSLLRSCNTLILRGDNRVWRHSNVAVLEIQRPCEGLRQSLLQKAVRRIRLAPTFRPCYRMDGRKIGFRFPAENKQFLSSPPSSLGDKKSGAWTPPIKTNYC